MTSSVRIFSSRTALTSILIVCLATGTAFGQRVKPIVDYARGHSGLANISVPKQPLREAELNKWAEILAVSEAQRKAMVHEYQNFAREYVDYVEENAQPYFDLSRELSQATRERGLSSEHVMELSNRLDDLSRRLRDSVTSIEHAYIRTIEQFLTPLQLESLHLVRAESSRRNCRTYHTFSRWDAVELRDIWRGSVATLASVEERAVAKNILADYEVKLTTLICRRSNMALDQRRLLWQNRVGRASGAVPSDVARERYNAIFSSRLELAQRIRMLQEQTIDRIERNVSEDCGRIFRDAVGRIVFPEIYPDDSNLHEFLKSLGEDEELKHDTRLFIAALQSEYEAQYGRMCLALESICNKWSEKAEGGDVGNYQPMQLPQALQPKLEERTNLSRRYLHQLFGLVGFETLERHIDSIPSALRSEFTELLEAAADTGN